MCLRVHVIIISNIVFYRVHNMDYKNNFKSCGSSRTLLSAELLKEYMCSAVLWRFTSFSVLTFRWWTRLYVTLFSFHRFSRACFASVQWHGVYTNPCSWCNSSSTRLWTFSPVGPRSKPTIDYEEWKQFILNDRKLKYNRGYCPCWQNTC